MTSQYSGQTDEPTRDQSPATQRKARVNRSPAGEPLGCPLWLNAAELRTLGIDPTVTDSVAYCVADGELQFALPDSEVTDE